jgi:putative acetyltransferase
VPADRARIREVVLAAFGRQLEVDLVDRVWDSSAYLPGLELVSAVDGDVVGHVLCSRAHIGEVEVVALGPLAVHPEHQRSGVGVALMLDVIARAASNREGVIGLLGHPTYYPRFGFQRGTALGVQPPMPMDDDAPFMVKQLGTSPVPTGRFRYCSAFDGLDS